MSHARYARFDVPTINNMRRGSAVLPHRQHHLCNAGGSQT